MHNVEGRLLLSPSDLVAFLACDHLTQLELAVSRGECERPKRVDLELEMLARKGEEHEAAQLVRLTGEDEYIEIADHGETLEGLARAEADTLAAMSAGVPLIYQATFFDGRWRGRADFLRRVETPSELGSWSYEVADAKLARRVKVGALLQMCEYSHQVTRLQGRAPTWMHVILGTGEEESHQVADYDAYFRAARERFEATVDGPPQTTYPVPVSKCDTCTWLDVCKEKRRADDHLCLVAGMRRDQTRRLNEIGITTVGGLAAAPDEVPARMSDAAYERLRRQAALQIQERVSGEPVHELIEPVEAGLGLAALPEPSPGDLFFDMEGDPFVDDGGIEYLFGITEIVDGRPRFMPFWGHDRAAEKTAFESVIDLIVARRERDPSLHVYHYAQYEPAALKKLMSRHATREDALDRLLRGGVFVDLYQVVRQGVRVSCESYGLKSLEVFYMPKRQEAIADAVGSIVAYERWRETRDQAELDSIATYNERDCESTWRLRGWLEVLRDEASRARGEELPRPEPRVAEPSEKQIAASAETQDLVERLGADTLLANLLDWHRREEKAAWWAFFDRQAKTDDELVDDSEAIGNITHIGEMRQEQRSSVHRYSYDGTQEHKIKLGDDPCDPRTGKPCGTVAALDDDAGVLELRRGPRFDEAAHPRSLIPAGPFRTVVQRDALRRLAAWVIENGVDGDGAYRSARDLLLGSPPRLRDAIPGAPLTGIGEDPVDAAVRLVASLDASFLAIQGPPGAGKTYAGARVIVDQVRRGRRIGVCATTHRAIGELLNAVCAHAPSQGVDLRILQKCDEDEVCPAPAVRRAGNEEIEAALASEEVDVVAGTPWLFARAQMEGLLDLLVIDEAGQMSLANALACAGAGTSLVLLGDPQQLAQPSRGVHPPGAGVSCLQHVLGTHETIPPDRGVFLTTTRRMHPEVCRFISTAFYDGRLTSHASCAQQRVEAAGVLAGSGLRFVAVPHTGNRTTSPEEVEAVRRLVDALLRSTWTDADGREHPLGLDDILVVAPYNVHVRRLRDALPPGMRVGTVDKFQGQQAPVVIYSMATSSAEDVPRNLEFLVNRNRLNVAVSRARALALIVCSAQLLHAGCRTPEQLRLVSALCRFAEMATPVDAAGELLATRVAAQTELALEAVS